MTQNIRKRHFNDLQRYLQLKKLEIIILTTSVDILWVPNVFRDHDCELLSLLTLVRDVIIR